MNPFTFIKRIFQAAGCLVVAVVMSGSALTAYIDKNPAAQERIELSAKDAEMHVDEDSTFFEKVGALISSWWNSDELIAEASQDKALSAESKKKRDQREREQRFNESHYSESDDYYGSSQ
jgi:hypothetical protein